MRLTTMATLTAILAFALGASSARAHAVVVRDLPVLPPGKTVTITFDALIDNPLAPGVTQLVSQGIVSGDNFTSVPTDDPGVPGAVDPTIIPIDPGDTTATLVSVPNPTVYGQEAVFSLSVVAEAPHIGMPWGAVDFFEGGSHLGRNELDAAGETSLTLNMLSAGPHSIDAAFLGNSEWKPSTGTTTHIVNKADTVTTITGAVPQPSALNQPVAFGYSIIPVVPGAGTPTGTVSVGAGVDLGSGSVAAGSASVVFTSKGPKSVTASYVGDANFNGGVSAIFPHDVINTPPTAVDDLMDWELVTEDSVILGAGGGSSGVLANDTDPDVGDVLTVVGHDTPTALGANIGIKTSGGYVLDIDSGAFYQTLSDWERTTDSTTYTITDNDGGFSSATLRIVIYGVNDDPTAIGLDNASVIEGKPAGALVGNLSTVDVDGSDTHTWTLIPGVGDADNALFHIDGSQLETTSTLEYDDASTRSIRIQTSDSSGGVFEEVFVIEVIPTDLVVDTLVDEHDGSVVDGDISLRDALDALAPGGTLTFDPALSGGAIDLALGEVPILASVTINGLGADVLAIDAGSTSRVFNAGPFTTLSIRGLTLRNGLVTGDGGAIQIFDSELIVQDCVLSGNSADRGGAIYVRDSALMIDGCSIVANTAGTAGGGLFYSGMAGGGIATLNRIAGNSAPLASGVATDGASLLAINNWWGCNAGPGAPGCDTAVEVAHAMPVSSDDPDTGVMSSLVTSPWLTLSLTATPPAVGPAASSTLAADLTRNSMGLPVTGADLPGGIPIAFSGETLGSFVGADATMTDGVATAGYNAGAIGGLDDLFATVDGQQVQADVLIVDVTGVLYPDTAVNQISTSHTVEAMVHVNGSPASAIIDFGVLAGPNAGFVSASVPTDPSGVAVFTYQSNGAIGFDTIESSGTVWLLGEPFPFVRTAMKQWVNVEAELTPTSATNHVGTTHTLEVEVTVDGAPSSDTVVHLAVVSGPNAGVGADLLTDDSGEAEFDYSSDHYGVDTIVATGTVTIEGVVMPFESAATKEWVRVDIVSLPPTATNQIGTTHTVTSTLAVNSAPGVGEMAYLTVVSGPNAGVTTFETVDPSGDVSLTYVGANQIGFDTIVTSGVVVINGVDFPFETSAQKEWVDVACALTPTKATNQTETAHRVEALVTHNGAPISSQTVLFEVTAGPNAGLSAIALTDATGMTSFTYVGGPNFGFDTIHASGVANVNNTPIPFVSNSVDKEWIETQLILFPDYAHGHVGALHRVSGLVLLNGVPQTLKRVDFAVISGPNTGAAGAAFTEANGRATFEYFSNGLEGTDIVEGVCVLIVNGEPFTFRDQAERVWVELSIIVEPEIAYYVKGETHTVTATLALSGAPIVSQPVSMSIVAGPNAGVTDADVTDANGQVTFTYTSGLNAGVDQIRLSGSRLIGGDPVHFEETVIASFETLVYPLTTHAVDGQVLRSPDQPAFEPGTTVGLQAVPDGGYHFVRWSGDVPIDSLSTDTVALTMDTTKTVTAHFERSTGTLVVDVTPEAAPWRLNGPELALDDSGSTTILSVVTGAYGIEWLPLDRHVSPSPDVTTSTVTRDGVTTLSAVYTLLRPDAPTTPTPVNGATDVWVETNLMWLGGIGADTFDVTLWPSSQTEPATPTATVTTRVFDPPSDLDHATTYSWRVAAVNAAGPTAGPVWTFTTGVEPTLALILDFILDRRPLTDAERLACDINRDGKVDIADLLAFLNRPPPAPPLR